MEFNMENNNIENKTQKRAARSKSVDVKRLVGMSMFAALAFAVGFATSWAKVAHLSFDAKDAVITLAAFIYGPISAITISLITAIIESLVLTMSITFWHGLLMDFVSSAAFALTATLIYNKKRSFNGALLGFLAATVVTTAVMLGLNILMTPLYMKQLGVPMTAYGVIQQIPKLLLPFNLAKALMNSALAMVLYKPVAQALRKAKLLKGEANMRFNKKSLMILIIAAACAILSIVIFIITKSLNS